MWKDFYPFLGSPIPFCSLTAFLQLSVSVSSTEQTRKPLVEDKQDGSLQCAVVGIICAIAFLVRHCLLTLDIIYLALYKGRGCGSEPEG